MSTERFKELCAAYIADNGDVFKCLVTPEISEQIHEFAIKDLGVLNPTERYLPYEVVGNEGFYDPQKHKRLLFSRAITEEDKKELELFYGEL